MLTQKSFHQLDNRSSSRNNDVSTPVSTLKRKASKLGATLALISLSALSANSFASGAPTPYTAQYQGVYKGMNITLKRSLKKTGSHSYSVSNVAKNKLASLSESSSFYLSPSNKTIQPSQYQYTTKYGPVKRKENVRFDWKKKTAYNSGNKKSTPLTSSSVADRISYQVLLRQHVKAGKKDIAIKLYNRGKLETYRFKVLKEETINTPAGKFKTTPVKRLYSDASKSQMVWLANEHDHILVKLQKKDKKGRYEIKLKQLSMK